MKRLRNNGFGHQRTLSAVFIVLTLALASVLAYNAQAAERSHRATVENTLREYAGFAAWEFARRARGTIDAAVWNPLYEAVRAKGRLPSRGPLPSPAIVRNALESSSCDCLELSSIHSYFRVDLLSRSVTVLGGRRSIELAWLTDSVVVRQSSRRRWFLFPRTNPSVPGGHDVVAFTFARARGGQIRAAYGFLTDFTGFDKALDNACNDAPLLPPTIAEGAPRDSLLFLSALTTDDVTVYESPVRYETTFAARDTLGVAYGGLIVQAAVRPDAAGELIIGGLPRSRLPLLFGLLVLTLGVGIAAVLQMRREHQLARLRDDFISGVSHELRTPLAQIRMFGELLDQGKLRTAEERKRSATVINREARRLTHLVENILHFSRLRRNDARLTLEDTDLRAAIGETVEAFSPLAAARNVRLHEDIRNRMVAPADRDALSQILLNLMDNALKYGPEGQTVTVGLDRVGDSARIWVEDEGPGIPVELRDRIWEAYRRLERDANTTVTGSGIGLSVVGELIASHNGRVWVEDGTHGARFVIELPGARSVPSTDPMPVEQHDTRVEVEV